MDTEDQQKLTEREKGFVRRTLLRTAGEAHAYGVPPEVVAFEFMYLAVVCMHRPMAQWAATVPRDVPAQMENESFYFIVGLHSEMLEKICTGAGVDTASPKDEKLAYGLSIEPFQNEKDKSVLLEGMRAMDGLLRAHVPAIWIMQNFLMIGMQHFMNNLPPERYRPILRDHAIHMRSILSDPAAYSAWCEEFQDEIRAGAKALIAQGAV